MAFNVILGKRYKLVKYIHVMLIIIGVGVFLAAGDSMQNSSVGSNTTLLGAIMLSVSLCFDGATGAYEDRLMNRHNVEPFDLMYNIQLGKAVISLAMLIVGNNYSELVGTIAHGGFSLLVLGITGAIGQVFVFITISKFGALNCALIGLCRKMLSLILSFLLYGHSINATQTLGLSLAMIAMIANFYEKGEIKFKENSEQLDSENLKDEKMPDKVCLLRISATTEDGTDITSGARGGDDGKGVPEGKIAFGGMHRL
jgi:UDP-galactose transporter B1